MPPGAADPPPNGAAKLGLALSGGGFRASFFHVGVLARMAEMRLLRRVEATCARTFADLLQNRRMRAATSSSATARG
jgi:hypothetical protein